MKTLRIIVYLTALNFLTSCSFILSNLYGVRILSHFNEKDYKTFLDKVPNDISFISIISTEEQHRSVISIGKNPKQQNDFGQPIQILYFEYGVLKSFHANCYAKGGLNNLNWNTDNRFSSFLPKSATEYEENTYLEDYSWIFPEIQNSKEKKFVILIFWSNMLRKVSLSAVETAFNNIKKFDKIDSTDIFLINSDKFFIALGKNNSP